MAAIKEVMGSSKMNNYSKN